jgi:hypothetical protein
MRWAGYVTLSPVWFDELYDPVKANQIAGFGYPNGFNAGVVCPWPPYFSAGETITNCLPAVGIKTRMRTMERAASYSALTALKFRKVFMCRMPFTATLSRARRRVCQAMITLPTVFEGAGTRDRHNEAG